MVKKRASLRDKGEEILGMKRGGKGADILFGTQDEAEPTTEPEDESTPSAEEEMPQDCAGCHEEKDLNPSETDKQ